MNKVLKNITKAGLAINLSILLNLNTSYAENKQIIKDITGAGSSFIYPVMGKWTKQYKKNTEVKINYQAIGSGGGLAQFKEKTIDFAATDEPLRIQNLNNQNAMQFPMVISGIVPIVHLNIYFKHPKRHHETPTLNLSGPVLAAIYLGDISKWNDPEIQKLNPDLNLPDRRILTVHRADGSGTTFNFTHYLSSVHTKWKNKISYSTAVSWPGRLNLGAKGNAGVAAQVQNIPNTIGYVEFAYAKSNNLQIANMYNKDNKKHPIIPSIKSFADAAKGANWSSKNGFYQILTNQSGLNSWPIVATTFILLPKPDTNKNKSSKQTKRDDISQASICFFDWAFKNGNNMAKQLNYIGMPNNVQNQIRKEWLSSYPNYKNHCPK